MPDRRLVLTVGTSLFASASWRCEGPFEKLNGYCDWVNSEELRKSPGRRQAEGHETVDELKTLLAGSGPAELCEFFGWDPFEPLRYSGELCTLIRMFQASGSRDHDLAGFLSENYDRIELVCHDDEQSEARIAARFLEAILRQRFGHPAVAVTTGRLRSRHLGELIPQFRAYLAELTRDSVDLVLTGGYKAFAMIAGTMLAQHWRLFYLHESQESELVAQRWAPGGSTEIHADVDLEGWFAAPGGGLDEGST